MLGAIPFNSSCLVLPRLATNAPMPSLSRIEIRRLVERTRADSKDLGPTMPHEFIVKQAALAVREGRGVEARILKNVDPGCSWTHVGLAFCAADDRWTVIHADPGNGKNGSVRSISLEEFSDSAVAVGVQLFDIEAGANPVMARRIFDFSQRCLGLPFDGGYDWVRTDAFYCSSLVWHVLNRAGLPTVSPPFPTFALPLLGARELILPSLLLQHQGALHAEPH